MTQYRTEQDSMGPLEVPLEAPYGPQTQRAVNNFPVSSLTMPKRFIQALALIKQCAAEVNAEQGHIDKGIAKAIVSASDRVLKNYNPADFPIDVFQTGSGTSSNMNMNEVLSHFASTDALPVHPNDHVNYGQSSNDVIPTAIHVSTAIALKEQLFPAVEHFLSTLEAKAKQIGHISKTGRTHLMDAMPLTFAQELGGWHAQIKTLGLRIEETGKGVHYCAQGGTAVGTGINADSKFAPAFAKRLKAKTKIDFLSDGNKFQLISSQDAVVSLSGQLKALATAVMKITNDIRWMNSGPLAGLGEITLTSLQPGSSIMPGKINPVVCESAMMVCAQVMGNDTTITIGGQHGNFQLNVMLPVIAYNILQSIELLSSTLVILSDKVISDFTVNESHIAAQLNKNPILITALNALIGYDKGAAIAKKAYAEKRPVLEVALEMTNLDEKTLREYLDASKLTKGGVVG